MRLDEFVNNKVLSELKKPNTRGLAGNLLKNNGYEKIGKGSFATVWGKLGEDFLIKIFDNSDKAYPAFVNLAMKNPNDHFPKFKGKVTKVNEKYSGIRVERLEPMSESQFISLGLEPVYKYLNYIRDVQRGVEHNWQQGQVSTMMEQMEKLEKTQPGMKQALTIIAQNLNYVFDVQPQNFMLRGKTVVILDPVV